MYKKYSNRNAKMFIDLCCILDKAIETLPETHNLDIPITIDSINYTVEGFRMEFGVKEIMIKNEDFCYRVTQLSNIENIFSILEVIDELYPEKIDCIEIYNDYETLQHDILKSGSKKFKTLYNHNIEDLIYLLKMMDINGISGS